MTYTDVWVSGIQDEVNSGEAGAEPYSNASPSAALTPLFPPAPTGTYEPYHSVWRAVRERRFPGRQVDWGAVMAVVSKADIVAFIDEIYGAGPDYCGLEHLCDRLAEVRSAVATLSDDQLYGLVAEES